MEEFNLKFPETLTTEEAAKILKVHSSTITRLIKAGKIKATQEFGRHWKIEAKAFLSAIERGFKRVEAVYSKAS